MSVSRVRQNYKEECEAEINRQINMEFYASYVYLSMVSVVCCRHDRKNYLKVQTCKHILPGLLLQP